MKTTKKRLVLSIAGATLLCVGAVFTTLAATAEPQITDETMLANIEALSQGEVGGQVRDCYNGIHQDVGDIVIWCYTCAPLQDYDDDLLSFANQCRTN